MNDTTQLPDLSGNGGRLLLDNRTEFVEFDVGPFDNLYLSLSTFGFASATWPTGTVPVLTVTLSVDGLEFNPPTGGAVTYNTAGAKAAVPVRGYNRARVMVTTAGSSSLTTCIVAANGSRLGA